MKTEDFEKCFITKSQMTFECYFAILSTCYQLGL